ncbi:MAG: aldehyde dehydrogenase [Pirellulales bacterium]|nr:aldehyde dehydrogenase [Pirellulales bacterium]
MSTAAPAVWYTERTGQVTPLETVDRYLDELAEAKDRVPGLSIRHRIELARACLDGMMRVAEEWARAACQAKGIPYGTSLGSEEVAGGPLATSRYLRLVMQSLADIERQGVPQLPGEIADSTDGRLRVQVVPTRGLFDSIAFSGFKAHVWQEPGVTRANLAENQAAYYRGGCRDTGIALVLGAGNVSSIPATDAFTKFFQEGKVVLLKMNPVNEYLGPIFERAFAVLIERGFLRIIYGGAEVGSHASNHALVDEVHITGSVVSHDAIVWGPAGPERDRRKAEHDPVLKKPISSELGNVSPWIIVPGPYTDKELRFQAENLASSIVNNASFNCVATKVIVTWNRWPQREQFYKHLTDVLRQVPPRKAYYPGAEDRYRRFTGDEPAGCQAGMLPWTVERDVDPVARPIFFDEESFVCVAVETGLDAADEADFLAQATSFANDRLFGTLGCTVMVHPKFRKSAANEKLFRESIAALRYGTIGINYWSALSYAMISPPWGGHPGGTIENPESGIGWVHNTYMFDRPMKTVLEGPLTLFPKPLWFPTTKNANAVTWKVVELCHEPSVLKLPGLLLQALKG